MQEKYTHMHKKVETTKQTLHEAENRIVRQDKIRETCKELQERAMKYEQKIRQRHESNALFSAEIGDFDFPMPLIDYDDEDQDGAAAACSGISILDETNSKGESLQTPANIGKKFFSCFSSSLQNLHRGQYTCIFLSLYLFIFMYLICT